MCQIKILFESGLNGGFGGSQIEVISDIGRFRLVGDPVEIRTTGYGLRIRFGSWVVFRNNGKWILSTNKKDLTCRLRISTAAYLLRHGKPTLVSGPAGSQIQIIFHAAPLLGLEECHLER